MKRTPLQLLAQLAGELTALITPPNGVDFRDMDEDQLLSLLQTAGQQFPVKLEAGMEKYYQRRYDNLITLALEHIGHRQWGQARDAAKRALQIKATSKKGKQITTLATALEQTLSLLSERKPAEAQARFADAATCGLTKLPPVFSDIEREVNLMVGTSEAFTRYLTAATEALRPGDTQNLALARENARLALETGWDNDTAQQALTLADTTTVQMHVLNARQRLTERNIAGAQGLLDAADAILPDYEELNALREEIEAARTREQDYTRHIEAARQAAEARDFTTARTEVQAALETGWDNDGAALELQAVNTTDARLMVATAATLIAEENGDLEEAQRLITQALTLLPDYVVAQNAQTALDQERGIRHFIQRVRANLAEGKVAEAREMLATITELNADHWSINGLQGEIEQKVRDLTPTLTLTNVPGQVLAEDETLTLVFLTRPDAVITAVYNREDAATETVTDNASGEGYVTLTIPVPTGAGSLLVAVTAQSGDYTSESWQERFLVTPAAPAPPPLTLVLVQATPLNGETVTEGAEILAIYQCSRAGQDVTLELFLADGEFPIADAMMSQTDTNGRVAFSFRVPPTAAGNTAQMLTVVADASVGGELPATNRDLVYTLAARTTEADPPVEDDPRSVPELIEAATPLMESDPAAALRLVEIALRKQPDEPTLTGMREKLLAALQPVSGAAAPITVPVTEFTVVRGQVADSYPLNISGGVQPYQVKLGMGATWITVTAQGDALKVKTPNPHVSSGNRELIITDEAGTTARVTVKVTVVKDAPASNGTRPLTLAQRADARYPEIALLVTGGHWQSSRLENQPGVVLYAPKTAAPGADILVCGLVETSEVLIWTGAHTSRDEQSQLVTAADDGSFSYTLKFPESGGLSIYAQPTGLESVYHSAHLDLTAQTETVSE